MSESKQKAATGPSGKPKRNRTTFSPRQLNALKLCYLRCPRPDRARRQIICHRLGLQDKVARVWFQNQRCKEKKESLELGRGPIEFQRPDSETNFDDILSVLDRKPESNSCSRSDSSSSSAEFPPPLVMTPQLNDSGCGLEENETDSDESDDVIINGTKRVRPRPINSKKNNAHAQSYAQKDDNGEDRLSPPALQPQSRRHRRSSAPEQNATSRRTPSEPYSAHSDLSPAHPRPGSYANPLSAQVGDWHMRSRFVFDFPPDPRLSYYPGGHMHGRMAGVSPYPHAEYLIRPVHYYSEVSSQRNYNHFTAPSNGRRRTSTSHAIPSPMWETEGHGYDKQDGRHDCSSPAHAHGNQDDDWSNCPIPPLTSISKTKRDNSTKGSGPLESDIDDERCTPNRRHGHFQPIDLTTDFPPPTLTTPVSPAKSTLCRRVSVIVENDTL